MKRFSWAWQRYYQGTRWLDLSYCPARRRWLFQIYKLFVGFYLKKYE